MRHSAESNSKIKYLREYKFIFKTALAHESGDQGVLFAEKNRGSKISWDCPFKQNFLVDIFIFRQSLFSLFPAAMTTSLIRKLADLRSGTILDVVLTSYWLKQMALCDWLGKLD
jgi:hypothetical protein